MNIESLLIHVIYRCALRRNGIEQKKIYFYVYDSSIIMCYRHYSLPEMACRNATKFSFRKLKGWGFCTRNSREKIDSIFNNVCSPVLWAARIFGPFLDQWFNALQKSSRIFHSFFSSYFYLTTLILNCISIKFPAMSTNYLQLWLQFLSCIIDHF